jgi:hypothetical protein
MKFGDMYDELKGIYRLILRLFKDNIAVKWLTLLHVWEIKASTVSPGTYHSYWLSWVYSVLPNTPWQLLSTFKCVQNHLLNRRCMMHVFENTMEYDGVSKSFRSESITKSTTINVIEKQHKGLWRKNSID